MAQAPGGGGGGAPRQNKTVKEFKGMNTQNRRNAIQEGQFGWLENIQPIGPGHLHSIPGRSASSVVQIPNPFDCIPPPTQENLSEVADFDVTLSPTHNNRTSWAFVAANPGGEIIHTLVQDFTLNKPRLFTLTNGVLAETTPLPPGLTIEVQNLRVGIADEPMFGYAAIGDLFNALYFVNTDINVEIDLHGHGYLTATGNMERWSKIGNKVYITGQGGPIKKLGSPPTNHRMLVEASTAGIWLRDTDILNQYDFIGNIHATPNFLYALVFDGSPPTNKIVRLEYTGLTVDSTFNLTLPGNVPAIYAVSDNLIYFVQQSFFGGPIKIGYWKNILGPSMVHFVHGSPPSEDFDITPNIHSDTLITMFAVVTPGPPTTTCLYYGSSGQEGGSSQVIVKLCEIVC